MKTLLEHLHEKYVEHLATTKGSSGAMLKDIVPTEGVYAFVDFAQKYLSQWRPSAINHNVEMNYRITLQDGQEVLISPPFGGANPPATGSMAGGSPSVPTSRPMLQPGEKPMGGGSIQM